MKIAHIVPIPDLELIKENEIFLCLAHLALKNETYRNFYSARAAEGKFVILDNGTAEGSRVEFDQLYRMISLVRPSEVVLPDELHDCYRSISLAEEFMDYMEIVDESITADYLFVPQGNSIEDYLTCAIEGEDLLEIQTIGASKFMGNKGINRVEFLQKLISANEKSKAKVNYHVLGLNSLGELKSLKTLEGSVRSVDTCFAALFAQNNSGFNNPKWRQKEFQFQYECFRAQYRANALEMKKVLADGNL